eukprot:3575365-Heterocapsa_arctica.AAC.1
MQVKAARAQPAVIRSECQTKHKAASQALGHFRSSNGSDSASRQTHAQPASNAATRPDPFSVRAEACVHCVSDPVPRSRSTRG